MDTKNFDKNSGSKLASVIDKRIIEVAKQVYNTAPNDKEVEGRIVSKDNSNRYTIIINNKTYSNIMQERSLGELTANTIVKVKVPNGQMSNAYICGVVDGSIVQGGGGGTGVTVVQTTGSSTTSVMSQNAVTVELNKKANNTIVRQDTDTLIPTLIFNEVDIIPTTGQPNQFYFTQETDSSFKDRNIGTIITSIVKLSDAGVHLLDGSNILQSGPYAEFYNWAIQNQSNMQTCSIADYATEMATYGVCGKFVVNNTANSESSSGYTVDAYSIKLPTITGFIQGTNDFTKLGNIIPAGLPNIYGTFRNGGNIGVWQDSVGTGPFTTVIDSSTNVVPSTTGNSNARLLGFDASLANSVYGGTDDIDIKNKVQPQAIEVFYYVVLANKAKTEIEIDIDNIMTDVNNKVNNDSTGLTNVEGWRDKILKNSRNLKIRVYHSYTNSYTTELILTLTATELNLADNEFILSANTSQRNSQGQYSNNALPESSVETLAEDLRSITLRFYRASADNIMHCLYDIFIARFE